MIATLLLNLTFLLAAGKDAAAPAPACSGFETREVQFAPGRTAVIWYPSGPIGCTPARMPVVVFSHGYGGCARQTLWFTQGLAARGYLVVAPNHLDAACLVGQDPPPAQEDFTEPATWTAATYADRGADVRAVLDYVLADRELGPRADAGRIAGVGHSLGGYTMMATGGAWPVWLDARFRAVLLFSPYTNPFLLQGTVNRISVPVMYQGGQLDFAVTPYVAKRNGAYDQSNPDKYFVNFYQADHSAWTVKTPAGSALAQQINAYSFAFLDRYLKGVEKQPLLDAGPHPDVLDYRMKRL